MEEIQPKAGSLKRLLENKEYSIHYYQREYRWQSRQVEQLLSDLLNAFDCDEADDYNKIKDDYPHYFMGSIIDISDRGSLAIIDGQQRLTSFTLLLIYLLRRYHGIKDEDSYFQPKIMNWLEDCILYGDPAKGCFNLGVNDESRKRILKEIYSGNTVTSFTSDTAETMYNRYKDIQGKLDKELPDEEVGKFAVWVLFGVDFIELTVGHEQDAYRIFVSMNDRGLRLSFVEMLKGYLLSEITDDGSRTECNKKWNEVVSGLLSLNGRKPDDPDNHQDSEFFQQLLRAKYAEKIRGAKKGAEDQDYEKIGSEFHQWVFMNRAKMGLEKSEDVVYFVLHTLPFYAGVYRRLVSYETALTPGFEELYYNGARKGISYQDMLILSTINERDSEEEIEKKIKLVSIFLDRYTTERLFAYKKTNWNTVKFFVFNWMLKIRGKGSKEVAILLIQASKEAERNVGISFGSVRTYRLYVMNRWFVKLVLARFTAYLDELLGFGNSFGLLMNDDKKKGKTYDIEHIVADKYSLYGSDYKDEEEFESYRNRIGDLILLCFDKNRSLQDDPAGEKIEKAYIQDNSVARSLNPHFYENNPSFGRLQNNFGIHSYAGMEKSDIEERSMVYQRMAEAIWSLNRLKEIPDNWTQEDEERAFGSQKPVHVAEPFEVREGAQYWIVPCNPAFYDIDQAVKELPIIPWSRAVSMKVGDVVYLYVAVTERKIRYRMVIETLDRGNIKTAKKGKIKFANLGNIL